MRPDADTMLLGSSKQPALFHHPDGSTRDLGTVVREAFARTNLNVYQWNQQSEAEIDKQVAQVVADWKLAPLAKNQIAGKLDQLEADVTKIEDAAKEIT